MTSNQLLHSMTDIDDIFIQKAAPVEKKTKKRSTVWVRFAAAACICLAAAGLLSRQLIQPASAFVIEDGVLTAYVGEDTEVVIPDEVTKIASSAFEAAPSPECITSVTLGANVETIDPLTFSRTKNLSNITIPEENQNFYYQEGVLLAADGSLVIDTERAYEDSMDIFIEIISDITDGENIFGEEAQFVFGKAELTVSVIETPGWQEYGLAPFECYITAIDFDGAHLDIANGANIISDTCTDFYQSDDMLLYSQVTYYVGDIYLLTDGQVWDLSNPKEVGIFQDRSTYDYNTSIYYYGVDETGNITYQRKPRKYVFDAIGFHDLLYCTGLDEFYMEEGYISIGGDAVVYNATASYTVGEKLDLEAAFQSFVEFTGNEPYAGWPACDSLSELLKYNKEHFESAK